MKIQKIFFCTTILLMSNASYAGNWPAGWCEFWEQKLNEDINNYNVTNVFKNTTVLLKFDDNLADKYLKLIDDAQKSGDNKTALNQFNESCVKK